MEKRILILALLASMASSMSLVAREVPLNAEGSGAENVAAEANLSATDSETSLLDAGQDSESCCCKCDQECLESLSEIGATLFDMSTEIVVGEEKRALPGKIVSGALFGTGAVSGVSALGLFIAMAAMAGKDKSKWGVIGRTFLAPFSKKQREKLAELIATKATEDGSASANDTSKVVLKWLTRSFGVASVASVLSLVAWALSRFAAPHISCDSKNDDDADDALGA